ncbi:FAD-binding protein [Haliangium sp. UPWRP_2]|uniref:electron transfer flavoprotein subunit alpha/FixB family protein n=1 Tax=Haliangium sp. UPWRP_2 TaxID=1931276 RepID=UPI000B53B7AF|nr:FAD-binding protein [Haliangium sp. UPWRP_2]PSM31217.1 electron transfer flavoprotein subunit alpha [Haliangium sp. UPWRP_2]
MGNVLIYLEQADGALRPAALSAITFARAVHKAQGGKLLFLLIGDNIGGAANQAATFGADAVLKVEAPALKHYLAETYAPIVARVAKEQGASFVGGTSTSVGKDLLPRVAGLLDAGLAPDISGVLSARQFRRATNAGNVYQTLEITSPVAVVSARQTEFPRAAPSGSSSPVSAVAPGDIDARGAEFVELQTQKRDRPDLTEARIVVSGGRGMKDGKNFAQIEQICDVLGAAMGASRAACDAGMVPNDLQVGQTGKVVAPDLYIAIAISGAIQHLAGMKGSKVIVAINKDAEAPIFQLADYGLVAQWEKALPELLSELKRVKSA